MEFKEMLKERKAAEESEKAKSSNEKEASGLQANEGEAAVDEKTNGEQAPEPTEENAESEHGKTDAVEKSDHINVNGEIESQRHNGDCTNNGKEKCQSDITIGVLTESQSKLNNIMMSANGTESESAVVNGNVCDVSEGSGDVKKQVKTE